ncbi:hypothetical protein PGUG_00814 [Meyerozyma guilliermondii ATCC 6260]|uniref:DNA-directed RNA polymerase subunit n=1 Tax=Meyerozyma guilliermondii (strain ATCC 6260 / CBS 566 / DSM 6381 / JCM 1539 / NBRC 10279 / NRRL Y-324) TaxID=294746 RepID=A5DC09_PICGU|nr:uncharacterized protein PGUG_00814 [Meyerozyma guilliermondii ATCC 6260]EDK36716.1 hypothetical protein PGUG_00814 [Meyerozyma guilliermondii ATCC 6260]
MPVETKKRASQDHNIPAKKAKTGNPVNKDGVSECFKKFTTELYVSLAPCFINDPINGIKAQHLDPLVMTYFPKAKGVVIAYSNLKLSPENKTTDTDDNPIYVSTVSNSSPFTYLWVTVDLLIWQPNAGDIIEGYSYMQTASHIGLLVHDTFNATIKKLNIPAEWRFVPSQVDEYAESEQDTGKFKSFGYWVDENDVKIEGKIKFTVKSVHASGRVVSLAGTLIKPGSEKDAQPVIRERRSSNSGVNASSGKHKKFDEEDVPTVTEIPEPESESIESAIPTYINSEEEAEDGAIVNNSDSEESESD